MLAYKKPELALILWLLTVVFVPSWTTFYVGGIGFPPAVLGAPILLGIGLSRVFGPEPIRINRMDIAIGLATLMVLFLSFTGELRGIVFVRDLLVLWVLGYLLGRNVTVKVTRAYVIIMAVVAAWGVIEFFFGMHLFTEWMPSANHTLNLIQERAGVSRSEATFGHGIAYGAALAMAIPFAHQLRKHVVLVQALLAAGILVSLSRGPMLALAFTLVLTAWVFSSDGKTRLRYTALAVVVGGAVYAVMSGLYSGVYSGEVAGSGNARLDQYGLVRDSLHWMSSALTFVGQEASPVVNGVQIIDSTPLRFAVNFGIIAAALLLAPVLIASLRCLKRTAGPASVALAGQIPVLLVTSPITQWQVLLFFMMGAVASEATSRSRDAEEQPDEREPARV
ncbi:hypothetical protein [Rhodococcus sp. (in: high G+C Gram-positive bacteria)]|uniref:hypothetical protein n=1 Tax=Rhodococcus sp. TaxID=1831 RepID=UPI00258EF9DA|nr:hypothetical protein [Rhodococcus sp. (in: high G+C Gram-positive bacteria)]